MAQHPYELVTYGGNGTVFQNWAQYLLTMKYLVGDERRADPGHVLRPPAGSVPQPPGRAAGGGDQRHGHPQLQQRRRLHPHGRPGRDQLRADDRRQLHVHRAAGHRARHHHHDPGCRAAVPGRARRAAPGRHVVRDQRPGRHERRPGQGRGDRRLRGRAGGDQPRRGEEAARAGLGGRGVHRPAGAAAAHPRRQGRQGGGGPGLPGQRGRPVGGPGRGRRRRRAGQRPDLAAHPLHRRLLSGRLGLRGEQPADGRRPGRLQDEGPGLAAAAPGRGRSLRRPRHCGSGTTATPSCWSAARAGADIARPDGGFKYPSYVEDIMGPLCFDYGFGPFRWVCTSGDARRSRRPATASPAT